MVIIKEVNAVCPECGAEHTITTGISVGFKGTLSAKCKSCALKAQKKRLRKFNEYDEHVKNNWKTCDCKDCARYRALMNTRVGEK